MVFKKIKLNTKLKIYLKKASSYIIILVLGDHITLNGMVNYLSEKFEKIYIPSKPNNYSTVKFMFENNKNVEIFEIGSENEYQDIDTFSNLNKLEILKVGFEKLKSLYKYNESFYTQLDLSYDISFDYFDPNYNPEKNKKLEEHLENITTVKVTILFYLEGSTGSFDLNSVKLESKLPKILIEKKSDIFSNIFFYLDVINNAKEVHCINSSIFTLVERIPTKGDLYFHNTKKEDSVKR